MTQANKTLAPLDRATAPINANKALWEKGDFTRLAETMRESGEELVDTLEVTPGMAVLDLGCGDGTTALPSGRRGAEVTGVDIAANLVAAGQARARQEGLANVRFEEGDASRLDGLANESFDLVVSIFGAMFAPRPLDTAREMVRVTKTGGRIVMGNWIPGDPTLIARTLQICAEYTPAPPPGFESPVLWGQEDIVRERFTAAGVDNDRISCERAKYVFRYPGAPADFLAIFRDYYGPTMNAFEAARAQGRSDELDRSLRALFEQENLGRGPHTEIAATYLKVTVRR